MDIWVISVLFSLNFFVLKKFDNIFTDGERERREHWTLKIFPSV